MPATEVLLATSAVKTTIREGKTHLIDNIIQTSQELGMMTLEKSLAYWVRMGKISLETAGSGPEVDEEQAINVLWADPETRNEREHLEALRLKAELGVDGETLLGEMGYNAEQVAKIQARQAMEQAQQSNFGGSLLEAFERGM